MDFIPGAQYSRPDVKEIAGLARDAKGGDWDTGIVEHNEEFIIFANVGTGGRTGHRYGNRWEGRCLRWYHRKESRLFWPSVIKLLSSRQRIHVFYRADNADPFSYAGLATALEIADTTPVEVLWGFDTQSSAAQAIHDPDEVPSGTYVEGATQRVLVNAYERSQAAREECLAHHGRRCAVCDFSFGEFYGELGKGFIHVHHLLPLAEVGKEYVLDPITDLRPVCPNCHAMLHRRRPALKIDELRALLRT